ncbi:hypothetical protein ACLB2K_023459 [Fragaria x ananassa]
MLKMNNNNFGGEIPSSLKNCSGLVIMDLGGNRSNGNVPSWISYYIDVATLTLKGKELIYDKTLGFVNSFDLSSNNLGGEIPEEICSLVALGQIPQSLSSLTSLSHLNLSYNNLAGRIPKGNQLRTLDDSLSIYEGNPSLCGVSLSAKCPGDSTPASPTNHDNNAEDNNNEDGNGVLWFYVSIILGFVLGFWGVCVTHTNREAIMEICLFSVL